VRCVALILERCFVNRLLHSISETTELLGVGRTLIYSLIARGQLDRVKLGNRAMVTRASIQRLIDADGTGKRKTSAPLV
jgi:excisionase family DNA binding protein